MNRRVIRRLAIGILISVFSIHARADPAILMGVVYVNKIHGPTLSGVTISAPGANTTTTKSNGQFELKFPNRKPGDSVQISAHKSGYEMVIVQFQSKFTLPTDPLANPVNLIFAKQGDREKTIVNLFLLEGYKTVFETFNKRLIEIQQGSDGILQGQTDISNKIDELIEARDKAIELLEANASQVANPQYPSELFEEARSLVLSGKAKEALSLLGAHNEKLMTLASESHGRIEQEDATIAAIVQSFLYEAQLLSNEFRFDAAKERYRDAIVSDPNSFVAQFSFAEFSDIMNRFSEAQELYQKALAIAERSGDSAAIAKTHSSLGLVHLRQNQLASSRRAYRMAMKIYREIAWQDRDSDSEGLASAEGLANVLNRRGRLLARNGQLDEARHDHEEALKIALRLAERDRVAYLPLLYRTYNSLSNISYEQMHLKDARKWNVEALRVARELEQQDPKTYSSYVGYTLNNLGLLHYKQNHLGEAKNVLDEAHEIYRNLTEENPERYRPFVAAVLNNRGFVLSDQKRLDEACSDLETALNIYRSLTNDGRLRIYQEGLSDTLNNLGDLYRRRRQFDQALLSYEEALEIRLQGKIKLGISETHNDMGVLYRELNRTEDALGEFSKALEIRSELAVKHREAYLPLVADTRNNLGVLYRELRQFGDARQALHEALGIRRELAKKEREAFMPSVADTLYNLGILFRDQGRNRKARTELEEALGIYNQLIKDNYEQYKDQLELVSQELQTLSRRRWFRE